MLEFLYSGDYDASPQQKDTPDALRSSEPANLFDLWSKEPSAALANGNDALGSSSHGGVRSPAAETGDGVLQHVRVSVIADYYDIKALAKLANSKIISGDSEGWNTQALADAIKESSDVTSDKDLQETMAALAAQNISALLDTNGLDSLFGSFGLKILRKYVRNVEAIEQELRDKTTLLSLSAAREEDARDTANRTAARTARTQESITRCLETLRERDQCRNHKCSALFSCYIEHRGHQPVYTLRCAKCGCRH
jgi:hypothetical protein